MYSEHSNTPQPVATHTGYWLKLGDAAHALGVSEITLRRKVKCGKLPHDFRSGKYFVFLYKDESTGRFLEPAQLEEEPGVPFAVVGATGGRPSVKALGSPVAFSTVGLTAHSHGRGVAMPSVSLREARNSASHAGEPLHPNGDGTGDAHGNAHARIQTHSHSPANANDRGRAHSNAHAGHPNAHDDATNGLEATFERERRAWRARIDTLETGASRDEAAVASLRRQVEDQQTLIAFLEETIQRIASPISAPETSRSRPPLISSTDPRTSVAQERPLPARSPSQGAAGTSPSRERASTAPGNTGKRP